MNTNLISNSKVMSLPYFSELSAQKSNRVITKHFTNLALYLPPNQFALLNWLIYQSKADNTVVYSTQLLIRYSAAVKECEKQYYLSAGLQKNIKAIRPIFQKLIESGYLLPNYKKNVFTINPMLTYRAEYMRPKDYEEIVTGWQVIKGAYKDVRDIHPETGYTGSYDRYISEFCRRYSEIVAGYMKKKKLV